MLKSLALSPFSQTAIKFPQEGYQLQPKSCAQQCTHLSLSLVWHIHMQESNSRWPCGKESFIAEFKSLVKPAPERIYAVSDLEMQIIFPSLSAFKSLKDGVKSSRPGKLSSVFSAPAGVRVNGVEHCWLLLKISSKDLVQSKLNSLDNSLDFYRLWLQPRLHQHPTDQCVLAIYHPTALKVLRRLTELE